MPFHTAPCGTRLFGLDASAPTDLTGRPTAELLPDGRSRLVEGAPHGMYVTARATVDEELLALAGSPR